ncbi:MAG: hypothetical protein DMF56_04045 [Acidobacteria bacterium]|nr:MAG: hypothetical protein DMF56_04045 [Acidobacteriota bacterium]
MKFLIDSCLSSTVANELAAAGYDVDSVRSWPSDPGDRAILAAAVAAQRVLVTADRGFGELAVRLRLESAGIIVLYQVRAEEHAAACFRAIREHEANLAAGGIVIVTPEKIRARWPPPDA